MASDLRQSPAYQAYMRSLGWQAANGAFIKKLPLLPFSLIKIQRPEKPVKLTALKKFRPIYVIYEPLPGADRPLAKAGFKSTTPLLPSKTVRLNLSQSLPRLLAEMHPKTRYNIKKHRLPIKVWRGDKIPAIKLKAFFEIYRQNSQRQHFWGLNFNQLKSLIKCFGENAYLAIARRPTGSDPVGGLLILIHDCVAYYSHNAATLEGRQRFAPTILTWKAIKLAKKLNCHTFDFEGITDERFPLTKKWAGFTRFKRGFGGKTVQYPGAFAKWLVF